MAKGNQAQPLAAQLPSHIDAERAVLGAIFLNNQALDTIVTRLHPEDFFYAGHIAIYRTMLAMATEQHPIDLLTISERMNQAGTLQAAGGASYLAQLIDGVPVISNIEHYAQIVRNKAVLRALVHAANNIQQAAMDAEDEPDAILYRANESISRLADERTAEATSGIRPIAAVIAEELPGLHHVMTSVRSVSGLSTGYDQLDQLLAGLHRGNVVVLAARPSIGKTALALNIAENVARQGVGVAVFSLEMSRREILQRLAASAGRINLHSMRAGGMSESDWSHVEDTFSSIGEWPIFIDDANPTSSVEIAAKMRGLVRKHSVGLVIVDYLQLVSGIQGRFSNRNEEVGASSRAFKAMARSLDVPVMVLSQLTRASEREERRPQLSDLRESGAIEQDADVVMFIHRPKAFAISEPPNIRNAGEVIIAKQRNGPTEAVKFAFLSPFARYEELAPDLYGQGREPGED